ncbi:hypothetical protein BDZ91DRAFT_710309 [Kalaharituber pfeilii]|nr:hypothetical protein BDZ91DRAFT_710309 [Kalaharituber pfeilii]
MMNRRNVLLASACLRRNASRWTGNGSIRSSTVPVQLVRTRGIVGLADTGSARGSECGPTTCEGTKLGFRLQTGITIRNFHAGSVLEGKKKSEQENAASTESAAAKQAQFDAAASQRVDKEVAEMLAEFETKTQEESRSTRPPLPTRPKKKKVNTAELAAAAWEYDMYITSLLSWPAPKVSMLNARDFITSAAKSPHEVLILPSNTINGICAGSIISSTLKLLGKNPTKIQIRITPQACSVFDKDEQEKIEHLCRVRKIGWVFILDQGGKSTATGSSPLPPIVESYPPTDDDTAPHRNILIIDEHFPAANYPRSAAAVLTSHGVNPVAATSLLTYCLCAPMHPTARDAAALHALLGTLHDSGNTTASTTFLRIPPSPRYLDLIYLHKYTITWLKKLVALLNAPRRAPPKQCNLGLRSVWNLIQFNPLSDPAGTNNTPGWPTPKTILAGGYGGKEVRAIVRMLAHIKDSTLAELRQCMRTCRPRFSHDGRIAVIEINTPWLVHTQVAPRWAAYFSTGSFRAKYAEVPELDVVLCANKGYIQPEEHGGDWRVTFFATRTDKGNAEKVDVEALLAAYVKGMKDVDQATKERLMKGMSLGLLGTFWKGRVVNKSDWEVLKEKGFVFDSEKGKKLDGAVQDKVERGLRAAKITEGKMREKMGGKLPEVGAA